MISVNVSDQSLGLIRETLEQYGYASLEEGTAFAQGEKTHIQKCVCMTFTEKFWRNAH